MAELAAVEHVKWRHFQQSSVLKRRCEIRAARGFTPKRRWKKGRGTHAKSLHPQASWSPFNADGSLRDA